MARRAAPLLMVVLLLVATTSRAAPPDRVLARVDGRPIQAAERDQVMERVIAGRPIEPAARTRLARETLEQLINRELVQSFLERQQIAASDADIRLALEQQREFAQRAGLSWTEYLERAKTTEEGLQRQLGRQLSWDRFLAKYRTEENLKRYFQTQRQHFDGTRLRVAHLLIKVASDAPAAEVASAIDAAEKIRGAIAAEKLTFAEAARKHSQAPTAASGGDLGWIERRQPMPEPFSRAAFSLEDGKVSEPIRTAAGIHLIYCLERQPGEKTLEQVQADVAEHAGRYLFEWAAEQQRARSKIERVEDG